MLSAYRIDKIKKLMLGTFSQISFLAELSLGYLIIVFGVALPSVL